MNRRTFALILAAVAAYKSLEHLFAFGLTLWPIVGAPLAIGALFVKVGRERLGMAVIAAAALLVNLTPLYRNHLNLLMWTALAVAIFDDEIQERFVLRCELSVMYGFAAVAKLWPDWLSGDALASHTWIAPHLPDELLIAVAGATILVEAALAYGAWSRWRGWLWLAVAVHVSFVAFTQTAAWDLGRLTVFGVLSLSLWLRAARTDVAVELRSARTASM